MWPPEQAWDVEGEAAAAELEPGSSGSSCCGSSRSHYSVAPDACPWRQCTEMVATRSGPIRVTVCGEASCPALVTYHDIGLNHSTCFQGLLLCEETASLLLQNWCIYHLDAPGHEAEALEADPEDPYLSANDLADQVADVAAHYGLREITGLGVSAGAYVLTLLATRHPELVRGLILVSPLCRAPTWADWVGTKLLLTTLSYYGMARHVKDYLQDRYFCQDQHGYHGPGSDALLAFRQELDERDPESVMRYMSAIHSRKDLTRRLKHVRAHCLVVVGAHSPFVEEAEHMVEHLPADKTKFIQVEACGSLVTEERPQALQGALRSFFKRVLPSVSSARGYNTPSCASSPSSTSPSASAAPSPSSSASSSQSSPPSGPTSPLSRFFSESRKGYVARSPVAVSFEELSLAPVQHRLRPLRTLKDRGGDSEDESEQGSPAALSVAASSVEMCVDPRTPHSSAAATCMAQ